MTFFAPIKDWTVFSIRSSRAWTRHWMVTSSGMWPFSINRRLKANSVFDAEGKPTSISLKPHFTSVWKSSSFWLTFMGTASAWLPSRRSTLHQMGAAVSTRLGHWRFSRSTGGDGRYFEDGFFNMAFGLSVWRRPSVGVSSLTNKNPTAGPAVGLQIASFAQTPSALRLISSASSESRRFRANFMWVEETISAS